MNIKHVNKVVGSLINGDILHINDTTSLEFIQLCEKTLFSSKCADLIDQQDGLYAKLVKDNKVYFHYLGPSIRYYVLVLYATNDIFLRGIKNPIFKLDAPVTTKLQLIKLTNFFNSVSDYKIAYNPDTDKFLDDGKPLFNDHKVNYAATKIVQKIFLLQIIYQVFNYDNFEIDPDWIVYDKENYITVFRNKELATVKAAPKWDVIKHPVVKASDRFSIQSALSHYGKTLETL